MNVYVIQSHAFSPHAARQPSDSPQNTPFSNDSQPMPSSDEQFKEFEVRLMSHVAGFGFRIIGGREEQIKATVGWIAPGGAADLDGRLQVCV